MNDNIVCNKNDSRSTRVGLIGTERISYNCMLCICLLCGTLFTDSVQTISDVTVQDLGGSGSRRCQGGRKGATVSLTLSDEGSSDFTSPMRHEKRSSEDCHDPKKSLGFTQGIGSPPDPSAPRSPITHLSTEA